MRGGENRELLLATGKMLLSPVTRAVSFKVGNEAEAAYSPLAKEMTSGAACCTG